jgi:hypothetical protein
MINHFILKLTIAFFLFAGVSVSAQETKYQDTLTSSNQQYLIIGKDTSWVSEVELEEVIIYPKLKFKSRDDFRDYLILKRKTKKVWPYVKLASERFETLNKRLSSIESKRSKRQYTRVIQRYVEEEFTDELKKLTKTEGQILVKLIHRQTGITTFDLVKDLHSGWRAFWYNTTASLFSISLKEEFNPSEIKEDFYIEDILQREFQSEHLERQSPKFEINLMDLMEKWQKESGLIAPSAIRSNRY